MSRPLFLVTNDDGILAPGIAFLVESIKRLGDVVVVAPESAQSGKSSAITTNVPLRFNLLKSDDNVSWYSCNGTPVDCVKLGLHKVLDREPDMVLSGINHGENTSVSIIYSGTMGAAIEGAMHNIPSIGLSLNDFSHSADFSETRDSIIKIVESSLRDRALFNRACLNVNFPKGAIKGIRVSHQTDGFWSERFDSRKDTFGNDYYWLSGKFVNREPDTINSDEHTIKEGYASVVPVKIDMTDYSLIKRLDSWNL